MHKNILLSPTGHHMQRLCPCLLLFNTSPFLLFSVWATGPIAAEELILVIWTSDWPAQATLLFKWPARLGNCRRSAISNSLRWVLPTFTQETVLCSFQVSDTKGGKRYSFGRLGNKPVKQIIRFTTWSAFLHTAIHTAMQTSKPWINALIKTYFPTLERRDKAFVWACVWRKRDLSYEVFALNLKCEFNLNWLKALVSISLGKFQMGLDL